MYLLIITIQQTKLRKSRFNNNIKEEYADSVNVVIKLEFLL